MSSENREGPDLDRLKHLAETWTSRYDTREAGDFGWFEEDAPAELVRFVEDGSMTPGPSLDIGCGAGQATSYLWSNLFRPAVGFDISAGAITRAVEHAGRAGAEACFLLAAAPLLPFRDASFALVFDRGCLHLLGKENHAAYVAELVRVLAPGGRCLLIERSKDWKRFAPAVAPTMAVLSQSELRYSMRNGEEMKMTVAVLARAS